MIEKIIIENFKCFEGRFELVLNDELNVIVGNNEAGKSTVLEAIHLALTGFFRGRTIKNGLSQYLFNYVVLSSFLDSVQKGVPNEPPYILIELYLKELNPDLEGDRFSDKENYGKTSGIGLKIALDDKYLEEYNTILESRELSSLPVEYYDVEWYSFARKSITSRSIPIKSSFIDVGFSKFLNGSDMYISRIIRDVLDIEDQVKVSQAYRSVKDFFSCDESITGINSKLKCVTKLSDKSIELGVDLGSRATWDGSLVTLFDKIPFDFIGKGEQAIIKTDLSLSNVNALKSSVVLIEEPESHISHTRLNQLITSIKDSYPDKQIIVTTHSSFVSNKLGLNNLILMHNRNAVHFSNIKSKEFFEKISGYDTLRFILCRKAILVEGDSDELVVQRAYFDKYQKLPIEKGVEVISVGTSFLRFLEIAEELVTVQVSVLTDNDGDLELLKRKYENYLGENKKENINIYFDEDIDPRTSISMKGAKRKFNFNTLEPLLLRENNLDVLNTVFNKQYSNEDDLLKYMKNEKTECALKILLSKEMINYPKYIMEAINEK